MSYPKESYEKYIVPALFGPWSQHLVRNAHPQPGERALDIACGTGIVTRHLAPLLGPMGRAVGLDFNPDMLQVACEAAKRESLPIEWVHGRAEQLGFIEDYFDLVTCQYGLMFFTDRHAALVEMRRVLKQGGRLLMSVWQGLERHPFYQKLHEASYRRLGTSGVQAVFSLGDAGELRSNLEEAGFHHLEIESASMMAHFSHPQEFMDWEIDVDPTTIPSLRNLEPLTQQSILDAVRQDMQASMHEAMEGDQLVIPFHAYLVRALR